MNVDWTPSGYQQIDPYQKLMRQWEEQKTRADMWEARVKELETKEEVEFSSFKELVLTDAGSFMFVCGMTAMLVLMTILLFIFHPLLAIALAIIIGGGVVWYLIDNVETEE